VKVPIAFKAAFDLVHTAFRSTSEEIEREKARIREGGFDEAQAYYLSTAALLRAGWNPQKHPHVALWRRSTEGSDANAAQ
jgi:hypothetical protein